MSNVIVIKRGSTILADGTVARVAGCPLASCDHALDVVGYINAAAVSVFDRATKETNVAFDISRQHASLAAAIHHAQLEAQTATGRADLVIVFNDGTTAHTWTLANAGWKTASASLLNGVRTVMSYRVTGGIFTYSGTLSSAPYAHGL